jgi:hypothetical protein
LYLIHTSLIMSINVFAILILEIIDHVKEYIMKI